MNRHDRPLPIRKRSNGWEVPLILLDTVHGYVLCDTLADAKVVADARPLHSLVFHDERCDLVRVRLCLKVLAKYGFDGHDLFVRHLMALESR